MAHYQFLVRNNYAAHPSTLAFGGPAAPSPTREVVPRPRSAWSPGAPSEVVAWPSGSAALADIYAMQTAQRNGSLGSIALNLTETQHKTPLSLLR